MAGQDETAEVYDAESVEDEARFTSRNSQAIYDETRREAKERAAVTIEKNAKEALKAKSKAQAKEPVDKGRATFEKRAKEIEAQHQARRKAAEK